MTATRDNRRGCLGLIAGGILLALAAAGQMGQPSAQTASTPGRGAAESAVVNSDRDRIATATLRPPAEIVGAIVDGIVSGSFRVNNVSAVGDPLLALEFEMPQGFEGYNIRQSGREMAQIVCALRDGGFADYTMQLAAMIELVDAFGNESSDEGMLVRISPARSAQMNCENALIIDMSVVADEYRLHRLLEG